MGAPDPQQLPDLWSVAPDMLAILEGQDGRVTHANPRWQQLLGIPEEELTGTSWLTLVHDEDLARAREHQAAPGSQLLEGQVLRLRATDGRSVPVRAHLTAPPQADHLLLVLRPGRAEEALEARLLQLEHRFQLVMTHAPVGMAVSRLDGPWVAVNPALCRLLDRSEQELLAGLNFRELTHPDDLPAELVLLEELIAGTRASYALDKRYLRPDNSTVWTTTTVTLVRSDGDRPGYLVAQCVDISEQKRVEEELRSVTEQLRASDALRLSFLRATSHELRAPLTVVSGLAETLQHRAGELDGPQLGRLLSRLNANTGRLTRLLEDLMDVDRLSSGAAPHTRRPAALDRLVAESAQSVELAGRTLDLRLEPVTMAVDAGQIERVVANLVANAVRHSPPAGRIIVTLAAVDGEVVLAVEDQGTGIPEGYAHRLFDPFVQAPGRPTDAEPGTGLGLTLVRELAALHGGWVRAGNRPEGGARFEVALPHHADHPTDD